MTEALKITENSKNPEISTSIPPASTSRFSKSQSTDSTKSSDSSSSPKRLNEANRHVEVKKPVQLQPVQRDIPIVVSKPAKKVTQPLTSGKSDDSSISDSSSSHMDQVHTKKSGRNLSKTLGYLSASEPSKVLQDQPPDSVDESTARYCCIKNLGAFLFDFLFSLHFYASFDQSENECKLTFMTDNERDRSQQVFPHYKTMKVSLHLDLNI